MEENRRLSLEKKENAIKFEKMMKIRGKQAIETYFKEKMESEQEKNELLRIKRAVIEQESIM